LGLRGVFDYKQIDSYILANSYFRKSKLNFNNLELSEGEPLPDLNKFNIDELTLKLQTLKLKVLKVKWQQGY
jgi:hypothetical protein